MRIISWNVRRATKKSNLWKYLLGLNPDIALLQEVVSYPKNVELSFGIQFQKAIRKSGKPQRFGTAIFVKGDIIDNIHLSSKYDWVNKELDYFSGNIVSCIVQPKEYSKLNVISVHSPAWPIDKNRLQDVDVRPIKLKENKYVWVTEIIWSALTNVNLLLKDKWIVGGDFNSSETFDYLWKGGPRGNREILDRMENLGFTECLRKYNKKLTPTYRNPSNGEIIHQIDHIFVTNSLHSVLDKCITGDSSIIFTDSLSDHLPIIADFKNDQ